VAQSARLVVTLVHGTWARNAPWTNADAPLASALRRSLGDIKIERFAWASWNRFSARTDGKKRLAELLDSYDSDSLHFIIAHSHGGNIAHDAAAGREDRVAGVVCLNTPFFVALGRETAYTFEIVVMYVGLILMWLAFGLYSAYGWHWLAAVGLFVAFPAVASLTGDRLDNWLRRRGALVHEKLTPPALMRTRVLCLTTSEDEAFGGLGFCESLANLPFLLMTSALLPLAWLLTVALLATGVLPVLAAPWELWTGTADLSAAGWSKWVQFLGSSFFYPGLAFLATFGAALLASLSLVAIPYGNWQFPDSNLFLRVMVSLVPVRSRAVQFEELAAAGEGLRHSLLYENDRAIAFVIDWIKTTLAAR
jgi:hypothetical protein